MARKLIANRDNTITSAGTEPLSREVARPIFGESVLAIDYNFAEKKILDDDITFSRASGATQTNSEGKICYAPENGLKKSSQLDNWSKLGTNNTTVTAATDITDPLGGNGAFRVTTNQANVGGIFLDLNHQVTKNNNTTVQSIYIRSVSGTKTTHVITHNSSSKGLVTITEDWQRIVIPYDSTLTAAANFYGVDFRDSATDATDVYLFAPQVSSSFTGEAVEYVPTTTAFVYKERFDYDKDGNSKGLLIEEGRTNLIVYSQNFSHSEWILSSSTIATSGEIDPSGGTGAYKLTLNANSSAARIRDGWTSTAGEHTFSVYVKKGTASDIRVGFNDEGTRAVTLDFNIDTGQIITSSNANNTSVQDCGNGWYRVSVTGTIDASGGDTVYLRGFTTNSNTSSGDYLHIWGAQLEQGSFPTSLIPTYGASASRSADIASVSGTAFSRFFKDTQGTTVVDLQLPRGLVPNYTRVYNFSDNSTSDEIEIWLHGANYKVYGQIKTDSINQGANPASNVLITSGEIAKLGQSYKTNSHSIIQDGFTGYNDPSVNLPTNISQLNIGGRHNNQAQLNGWIRRLRYFNKCKSDTQVQKLTDTSFLLDKFKGAKAAHSLRSLRDGRDNSPVCSVRRSYDSHEAGYTANQVTNGELENDFKSEAQTTLPLDVSVEATELVTNGTFDSNTTGWTATNAQVSASGGHLVVDDTANAGTDSGAFQNITTQAGKTYTLSFDRISTTSSFYYHLSNALINGSALSGSVSLGTTLGNFTTTFVATSSTSVLKLISGGTGVTKFDNVSVKEVNPIATGFSTRKINSSYTGKAMRCRNQGNVEVEVGFDSNNEISLSSPVTNTSQNLLAYSEDFGQWGYHSTYTPTLQKGIADPFGGNNAGLLTAAGSNNASQVKNDNLSLTSGTHYTVSLYIKKGTSTKTRLGIYKSGWIFWTETTFDASGVPSSTGNLNSTNISYEKIGDDGWYRFSFVGKATTTASNHSLIFYPDRNATNKNAYIFGAQLEETQYDDGVEKITNGTFDTDSDWSDTSGVSISNGKLNFTITNGGNQFARQSGINYQVGKKYRLTAKIKRTSLTAGGHPGGVIFRDDPLGSGDLNHVVTLDGTEQSVSVDFTQTKFNKDFLFIGYDAGTTFTFEVDDVSLLEISPELQTYAQTPVISNDGSNTTATTLGEFSGLENLFTHSDDMSTGWNWISNAGTITANATTDPTGGTNAIKIVPKAISGNKLFRPSSVPTNVVGDKYCLSIYVKSAGHRYFKFYLNDAESRLLHVDLQEGTIAAINNINGEGSIEALANDWYRVSLSHTVTSSVIGSIYMNSSNASNFPVNFTGDGTSGVFVWGAQFNTNSLKPFQATTGTALTGDVNVVNWYDQGGGEDFTQSNASYQPRIVMGSELVTDSGGKASVYFDGGDTLDNNTLAGHNRLDSYTIQETSDTTYVFLADPNSSNRYGIAVEDGQSLPFLASEFGTPSYYVNGALQSFADRDDAHDVLTGKTNLLSQHNASTKTWTGLIVGQYFNGTTSPSYNYTGKISEMVFFPNMDSSPKRFPIEQNMLNHFDVYLVTNGTFDADTDWTKGTGVTISNGKANFSNAPFVALFQNIGQQTGKVKVTFDVTDYTSGTLNAYSGGNQSAGSPINVTATAIGSYTAIVDRAGGNNNIIFGSTNNFTGSIDNVKVQEYGTDGYVTKLFDQTGNNCHALQATAAYQPQIVSGGDLIKSGNRPAWEYKNNNPYHVLHLHGKIQAARLDAWFVHDTSDPTFIYPANYLDGNDFGWVAQDGSSSTSTSGDYGGGDSKLYANGTLVGASGSITRDAIHSALNGRKLVHHQDADTADWSKLTMGWYGNGAAVSSHIPYGFTGKFSEWIWYDSDQSSNKTNIESNINTHYNIY